MKKFMYYIHKYQVAMTMILALFLLALFAASDSEAYAGEIEEHDISFNSRCIRGPGSVEDWVGNLIENFDERPVFVGSNKGGRIIILRHSHNSTWTLLMETQQGTCMLTSGENHHVVEADGDGKSMPETEEDSNNDRI